tara:strand:+ start:748 stop:912 length:165 start_codon:yes stop_codon:yes gene_type:complete
MTEKVGFFGPVGLDLVYPVFRARDIENPLDEVNHQGRGKDVVECWSRLLPVPVL